MVLFAPLQERSGSQDPSGDIGRPLQGLSRGNSAGPAASNDTQGSGGPSGAIWLLCCNILTLCRRLIMLQESLYHSPRVVRRSATTFLLQSYLPSAGGAGVMAAPGAPGGAAIHSGGAGSNGPGGFASGGAGGGSGGLGATGGTGASNDRSGASSDEAQRAAQLQKLMEMVRPLACAP